jgi:hypothetical protein
MISLEKCEAYLNECQALGAEAKLSLRRATAVMGRCRASASETRGESLACGLGEVAAFQQSAWVARAESRRCIAKDGLPFAAGLRSREKLHSTRFAPAVV